MIDIEAYRDEGAITGGRGTPRLIEDFNMKDSASYTVEYYPTKETSSAPLVRPANAGEQDLSYQVFTFFKIMGDGEKVKNLRLKISVTDAPEADGVQLFYKLTNTYSTPSNAYDGDMTYLGTTSGGVLQVEFWPMLSTSSPHLATSRQTSYTLSAGTPLYTNYFVTQARVNKGSTVGNSAEFTLKMSVHEYL